MPKKHKRTNLKLSILAAAVMALPLGAQAAGLGKLSVLSALGQPLRAELEVTAAADELNSLSARVAPADVFRQANIEYVSSLGSLRFTLEKRAGGQPYFRITSDRPISDPFLDFLVELNWSAGRLVREYTFLLDPPELKPTTQEAAAVPVTVPEAVKPAEVVQRPVREAVSEAKTPRRAPRPVSAPSAPSGEGRLVKRGDTLGKIAAEHKSDGVSLDQMLVALFRGNPDAFDGGNMNRLKAGKILSLPGGEAAAAVPASEARGIVLAQSADFNAYRKKLAASVASAPTVRDGAPQQAAAGKIVPRIEDKAAPVVGQDKLQVSRTEAGKSTGADAKGSPEDVVTRDKALKEAKSRIAELEKNLADLKKLAEMKSQAGAAMQQQAQADKAVPLAETKKVEPSKASAPLPPPAPAKVVEAPKGGEPAPSPAPQAAAVPAKKPVSPPPQPPSSSFIEENGPLVFGGGGLLALLAGYFGFRTWQRKRSGASSKPVSVTDSSLYASSVFSASGGEHVDTGAAAAATDFGLGAADDLVGHEAVDPVQEADVYLAYGRDAQAEEILLDALKQDPTRLAVHLKLLEVYAGRRAVPQFNTVATDLHAQTSGTGGEWEKALLLGRTLDPSNPLYGGELATSVEPLESFEPAAATVIMPTVEPEAAVLQQEELPASLDFDLDLSGPAEVAAPEAVAEQVQAAPAMEVETVSSLDFDLGLDTAEVASPASAEPVQAVDDEEIASLDFELGEPESPVSPAPQLVDEQVVPTTDSNVLDFDFDLGSSSSAEESASAPVVEVIDFETPSAIETPSAEVDDRTIDFDLDTGSSGAEELPVVPEAPALAEVSAAVAPSVDFDFDLDLAATAPEAPAGEASLTGSPEQASPLPDLSDISLELDTPVDFALDEPSSPLPDLGGQDAKVEDNPEAATKLELAQAYEEMGDKEGARELFQEVIGEGSPTQQALARDKLARLG